MKTMIGIASVLMLSSSTPVSIASGPLGIYCIVEKVIFEPNAQSPARLQLWGSFMFVDGGTGQPGATTAARRGYLYFSNPGNSDAVLKGMERPEVRCGYGSSHRIRCVDLHRRVQQHSAGPAE